MTDARIPFEIHPQALKALQECPEDIKDVFGSAFLDIQYRDVPGIAKRFGEGVDASVWKLAENHEGNTYRAAYSSRTLQAPLPGGPPMSRKSKTTGTDNIFEAMGFADADERLAKAEIARAIRKEAAGMTQQELGEKIGLTQGEVSELVRGKLARFSRLRLERCAMALGLSFRVQIGHRSDPTERAGLEVEFVESL